MCITIIVPSIAVRLASDEYDDLKKYAMSKNMTTSEVVRNAIFFTRFMDELQTSELLNGFMRSKIIDTAMLYGPKGRETPEG